MTAESDVRAILRDLGDASPPEQIVELLATRTPAVVVGYLRGLGHSAYRARGDAAELVELRAEAERLTMRNQEMAHHQDAIDLLFDELDRDGDLTGDWPDWAAAITPTPAERIRWVVGQWRDADAAVDRLSTEVERLRRDARTDRRIAAEARPLRDAIRRHGPVGAGNDMDTVEEWGRQSEEILADAAAEHQELLLTGQVLATAEELLAASGVRVERLRQTLAWVLLSSEPLPDDLAQDVEDLVGDLIYPQEDER